MLTKENYFTNPDYLHSSQIRDYIESPLLYKLRYIDKHPDYQFKQSSAVIVGTIVDELLTEGKTRFSKKVLKRDNPEKYAEQQECPDFIATDTQWENATRIAEQLPNHPVWKTLTEEVEFQKIVEGEIDGMKVCGKIDGSTPHFNWDLKCTQESRARSSTAWYWHTKDLKYHIPASVYTHLDDGDKPFYHLVCYLKNGLLQVKLYEVPAKMIADGMSDVLWALGGIKEGYFKQKLTTFEDLEVIPWGEGIVEEVKEVEDDEF